MRLWMVLKYWIRFWVRLCLAACYRSSRNKAIISLEEKYETFFTEADTTLDKTTLFCSMIRVS